MIYVYMLILDDKRREESAVGKRVFFFKCELPQPQEVKHSYSVCAQQKLG